MDLRKVHFLVIEDSHPTVLLVRSVLGAWGAAVVHEASTVERALDMLTTTRPDLAILDQRLGLDDGLSLLRFIRHEGADPYLPVIVLSADGRPVKVAEARDAGANAFLVKPFTARGLYDKLQSAILRPRPFVRSKEYFGPDRRRRDDLEYAGPERRTGGA
ncbi:response regulator [Phenylobacterium sp. J426]|uniref:response regulator n=1 Tax=Phenylobacterium sp. J426 TaxID=2898439 RepID=UPI0021518D1C|nr:response regulator [Phenylobacterium sp. J426]MCR5876286.1 response regulator [Phenylobacterium sp. J426]